jgi:hypothetical protein
MTMFRQMIVAAVAAGLIATTGTVASSKVRHHGYGYDARSYGFSYGSGERTDPTNINGD